MMRAACAGMLAAALGALCACEDMGETAAASGSASARTGLGGLTELAVVLGDL